MLIQVSDGTFYGVTRNGGAANAGTVFRLTVAGAFTVLHEFAGRPAAEAPVSIVRGADGNFYGTSELGGESGYGTIFKITPTGVATLLHSFTSEIGTPSAGLALADDGSLLGSTQFAATLFRITPTGTFSVLHRFNADVGVISALIRAGDGNFYGTSSGGGASGGGMVFKITAAGVVSEVRAFGSGPGGRFASPRGGVAQGPDGNFYGTTVFDGASDRGTLFRLTPTGTLTVLHNFAGGADGERPFGGVIVAPDGSVVGTATSGGLTTPFGGQPDSGVVFRFGNPQPPVITAHPESALVRSGHSLTLSVSANGFGTMTYQWYAGTSGATTTPLAGATGSSYTTPPLTSAATYWVRVTDANGSRDSATASLSIQTLPVITTHPSSQTVLFDHTVTFTAAFTGGQPPTALRWQTSADDGTTWRNIIGATSPSYSFVATIPRNGHRFRIALTSAAGVVHSNVAVLTVLSSPACTSSISPASVNVPAAGASATVALTLSDANCSWGVLNVPSWISVPVRAGTGSASIAYTVAPNIGTTDSRTGSFSINGQSFTVTQAGCAYALSVDEIIAPPQGTSGSITMTTTAGCFWMEASNQSWLTVTRTVPNGSGQINYVVAPSTASEQRIATISAGGQSVLVRQLPLTIGPPGPPSALAGTIVSGVLTLSWRMPTTGGTPTGYRVEVGSNAGLTDLGSVLGSASTTFTYNGVPDGRYFFRVRATNSVGTSTPSNEIELIAGVGAPPPAPIMLAGNITNGLLSIQWMDGSGGGPIAAHLLEVGSAGGLSDLARVPLGAARSFTYAPVPPGRYFFRVRAVNARGNSSASNELELMHGVPTLPGPPQNLIGQLTGPTLTLSWSAASGTVTSYVIQAGSSAGMSNVGSVDTGSTATTWSFTGVPNGQVFFLRVRARNEAGLSLASNEIVVGPAGADVGDGTSAVLVEQDAGVSRLIWRGRPSDASPRYLVELHGFEDPRPYRIEVATGQHAVTLLHLPEGWYDVVIRAMNDDPADVWRGSVLIGSGR